MASVTRQIEITVRMANEPAALGRLMAVAGTCGVEILAAGSYWDRTGALMMLVTDDARRTTRALAAAGFECKSNPILLVEAPDEPGLAARLGATLSAAGIGVVFSYAFRSERNLSYVVFKTTDDERALQLLEVETLIHGWASAKRSPQPAAAAIEEAHSNSCAA